jgi:excisionase family DNA binding protein
VDDEAASVTEPPPRPVESFVHGLDGPLAVINGREAIALLGYGGLDGYLRGHRGADRHLDTAGAKLRLLSAAFRAGAGPGTTPAERPEPASHSDGRLTVRQVADLLGLTPRGVRKAIGEGRLRAAWSGGRWLIDSGEAEAYRNWRQER